MVLELLEKLRKKMITTPFIMLTGKGRKEVVINQRKLIYEIC